VVASEASAEGGAVIKASARSAPETLCHSIETKGA